MDDRLGKWSLSTRGWEKRREGDGVPKHVENTEMLSTWSARVRLGHSLFQRMKLGVILQLEVEAARREKTVFLSNCKWSKVGMSRGKAREVSRVQSIRRLP